MQWIVLLGQCSVNRLVVHVPHSSIAIPDNVWSEFLAPKAAVEAEALTSADLYTDEMARQAWPRADIVEAEVSRLFVDVERYDEDDQEEMADVGRGVFYTCDHQMRPIREAPSKSRREELLNRYYRPHWARLRSKAKGSILVDLHTYPVEPWPIERHAVGPRPEIDIGFSEGLTPISWVVALTEHFRFHGYEVGHNSPYAGVIDAGAMSAVMIEIRRDIVGVPGHDPKWCRLIDALRAMPLEG